MSPRRLGSLAALLAVALLLAACRTPIATGSDRQAYAHALETLASDPEAGLDELRRFLAERPASALADDAALRLADALVARGESGEAVQHLAWALRLQPRGDRSDAIRLLLARLQLERGHAEAAYRNASEVRFSLLPREQRRDAHRLLADAAGEAGHPEAELRWLAAVRADQDDDAAMRRVDAEIDDLLRTLGDDDLERIAEQLGRRVPAARVRLRQAELRLAAGDLEGAERVLARARKLPMAPADADRMAGLEARVAGGAVLDLPSPEAFPDGRRVRGTLGVALPLTGPLATVGHQALEGVILASGALTAVGADAARGGLRLEIRDTGGDPTRAAEAVASLGANADVLAVVGPLTAAETEAAAPAADEARVPMLALTQRGDAARGHPFVFRLGLALEDELALLADYAVDDLGVRRVAILYPRDDYGRERRALFWDAVEARGSEVVGVAAYDVAATDFAEPIRRLAGWTMLSKAQENALAARSDLLDRAKRRPPAEAAAMRAQAARITGPGGTPLPPFVDFDALFIPDSAENVGLIAPALAFHEVRGVRLLGPNGWNDPELVALGGEHVEGAVFTGAVDRGSRQVALAGFAERFEAGFGRPPDAIAAQSFDATLLVVRELLRGNRDRGDLRDGLLTGEPLAGVSGALTLDSDGAARRRPHLLGVEGGAILSVDALGRPPLVPGRPASGADGAPPG